MKRIVLLLTLAIFIAFSQTTYAADIISFAISSASSISGTGFEFQVGEGSEAKVVKIAEEEMALYLKSGVAYSRVWSSTSIDYLVVETRLMSDGISGEENIRFRTPQGVYWDVLRMTPNGLKSCNKDIPNSKMEAGRWYDIKIALKKNPSYMVDVWIDGVKVASNAFEQLEGLPQSGFQLRFEIGSSGMYIGDTRMYTPNKPSAEVKNPILSEIDEPVFIKIESDELDTSSITKGNIKITDKTYGTDIDFELERTDDGMKISFISELLVDNSYVIDLEKVVDISGQSVGKLVFETPLPDEEYSISNIKLYKGFDQNEEITKPENGVMTISAEVKNGGIRERGIALVCLLYDNGVLSGVGVTETTLQEMEETELSLSIENTSSNGSIKVMFWDGFMGIPIADAVEYK